MMNNMSLFRMASVPQPRLLPRALLVSSTLLVILCRDDGGDDEDEGGGDGGGDGDAACHSLPCFSSISHILTCM